MSRATEPTSPGPIRGSAADLEADRYDLAVIGGGIYGVATTLEAARRGLKVILLERDDFGAGVSWASHRIIHGGLRYLQSLDVARFRESVRERRWFMETFPEHVEPLACLVPLDNSGTRRRSLFAAAALVNNTLNAVFGGSTPRLPGAQPLPASALAAAAPAVDAAGVSAVGRWHDGLMVSSERVLIGMLRRACDLGAVAFNFTSVQSAKAEGGQGGIALGCVSADGREVVVRARRVVNATGPSCGSVAAMFGGAHETLFEPMRAFNVLLDVEPELASAVALESKAADGRMLFVVPGPAGLAIGTWEEPADGHVSPAESSVRTLLELAGSLLGRGDLTLDRVSAVWSGLLPRKPGPELTPADRPRIVDHGKVGGMAGTFSVSGVKYTTARHVAETVLGRAFPERRAETQITPVSDPLLRAGWLAEPPEAGAVSEIVRGMIRDEAARTVDDVCRRRTAWYARPDRLRGVASAVGEAFGLGGDDSAEAVERAIESAREMRG